MSTEIRLNRVSSQATIGPVRHQEFYSRVVPIPEGMEDIIWRIEKEHAVLRKWMVEAYNLNPVAHNRVQVEMPKELLAYGEEVKTKSTSKKGGATKRVRAGSDGDAKVSTG